VPVAYRATLNAQIFRIVGNSLKAQGVFPKLQDIITTTTMTAAIEDAELTGKTMSMFSGVKTAGHTFDVTARGLVTENVSFVAIKLDDESDGALA
jgi:hypothetical protein